MPRTPLDTCRWDNEGAALVYVDDRSNPQVTHVWDSRSGGPQLIDISNAPRTRNETQIAAFMIENPIYRTSNTSSRACVVIYQSPTDSSLLFSHVLKSNTSTNGSDELSFYYTSPRHVPLVRPDDQEYQPLVGTSLRGPQAWLSSVYNNATRDYNGAATVFYQTVNGKVVASVFDPNTPISMAAPAGPELIRSEELGPALPHTPLAITADANSVWIDNNLLTGDFTVYAMSKPTVISTWYLNDKDIRTRDTKPVTWNMGPTLHIYQGAPVAGMTSDRSKANWLYVAAEGMKEFSVFKQSSLGGGRKAREWTTEGFKQVNIA